MNALPCLFIRPSNRYAGDTSLPGGMSEEEDKTIEDTLVSSTTNSFVQVISDYSTVKEVYGYFLDLSA